VFSTIAGLIGGTVGQLLTLAENFLGISNSAEQAAGSTADLGGELAELTEEESKQAAERDKFLQGFTENVSKAIDESAKFGQAGFDAALEYQTAIQELQAQFDKGILNEESFRREAESATAAYNAQIDTIKKAAAETEAITTRVDALLAKANEIPQAQKDLNDLQAEIARVEAELVGARAASQNEQANALAARLAQLDQLQAQLTEQSEQAAQGFSEGFDQAFAEVDTGIEGLIDKAAEFGNEGAIAASQLTEGIEAAKEAVKDGILNKTAFDAEVKRQNELFEDRVAGLQEAAKITEELYAKEAELLDKQFEIEKDRAEALASIRTGSIQISDIRDGGISQFFDVLREDPAIGEARKQTKELEKIRQEIAKLNAQRVDILAGVG
jgi:DNA repair exonuclease SbcCD ATPase subunit